MPAPTPTPGPLPSTPHPSPRSYLSADQGNLFVVVAPVARFRDIPFNSSLDIQALGTPDQLIAGFAPELYGGPLQEDDVLDMQVGPEWAAPC